MRYCFYISLVSVFLLALVGCKDTPLDPDPDYPYYTISGRVFEGYGEVPLANSQIKLEYTDQGANFLEGIDAGVLGTTKTDADGYFTLDYQGFTGSPPDRELDGLYLYAGGKLILEVFPWNVSFERDFAQINHFRMVLQIEDNRSEKTDDTLFFDGYLMGGASYVEGGDVLQVEYVDDRGIYRYVRGVYPISDTIVSMYNRFAASYDHTPIKTQVGFTTNTAFFRDADKLNIVDVEWRGFPYTDTVSVTLTD